MRTCAHNASRTLIRPGCVCYVTCHWIPLAKLLCSVCASRLKYWPMGFLGTRQRLHARAGRAAACARPTGHPGTAARALSGLTAPGRNRSLHGARLGIGTHHWTSKPHILWPLYVVVLPTALNMFAAICTILLRDSTVSYTNVQARECQRQLKLFFS